MRHVDVHRMTSIELALLKHEITDEIRQLREVSFDLGPTAARESSIEERYSLMAEINRELAHRRIHPEGD